MYDLSSYLPARKKSTASGWISFNAVCCQQNGHKPDRRGRGGIKFTEQDWVYHCFNCGYKTNFVLGRPVSFRARMLLTWLGVSSEEIERINLESLRHRSVFGIISERSLPTQAPTFITDCELPQGACLITAEHKTQWQYLRSRSVPEDIPVLSVIDEKAYGWRPNVIVPFTWNNNIVGWTARMLDDRRPKYITDSQPGYVFGCDFVKNTWNYVIVVEGIFDALSIGGLAIMHNDINQQQAQYIKSLNKSVIFVPDQDHTGLKVCDRALELGWAISMPPWPNTVKDVNDAVKLYGRLGTMAQIMQYSEHSKIKVQLARKQIIKRLNTTTC
jgi:hypothetical protein